MSIIKTFFLSYYLLSCIVFSESVLFRNGNISFSTVQGVTYSKYFDQVDGITESLAANVKTITLHVDRIDNLYPMSVRNHPTLWQLKMRQCGINQLSPGAFFQVPNLSVLKLPDNNLTSIPAGVFNNLNITRLILHRNLIQSIDSRAFDDMPRLQLIKLNYNFLKQWNSDWFKNCPNLATLYFKKNEITYLPERAFKNINGVHLNDGKAVRGAEIFFSNNAINRINKDVLGGLSELDQLWLDKNDLEVLDLDVFRNLKNFNHLNLADNFISEIHGERFGSLSSMEVLDLKRNNLSCVPVDMVYICKRVYLQKNPITCVCASQLFKHTKQNYTSINLRNCRRDLT